jgi:dihydroneopterin aldolase
VKSERYYLLERLATRIAEVCRVDERVTGVVVTIRKLHPPVRAMVDHVAVRIEQ